MPSLPALIIFIFGCSAFFSLNIIILISCYRPQSSYCTKIPTSRYELFVLHMYHGPVQLYSLCSQLLIHVHCIVVFSVLICFLFWGGGVGGVRDCPVKPDLGGSSFPFFFPYLLALELHCSMQEFAKPKRNKYKVGFEVLMAVDGCLLGCSAVLSGRSLPTFQRSLLPPSSV
jgi:hypothetical protein